MTDIKFRFEYLRLTTSMNVHFEESESNATYFFLLYGNEEPFVKLT